MHWAVLRSSVGPLLLPVLGQPFLLLLEPLLISLLLPQLLQGFEHLRPLLVDLPGVVVGAPTCVGPARYARGRLLLG